MTPREDGWEELRRLAEAASREHWDHWDWASWSEETSVPGWWNLDPRQRTANVALTVALTPDVVLRLLAAARGEPELRELVEAYAAAHPVWLDDDEDGCPESIALRAALATPTTPEPGDKP